MTLELKNDLYFFKEIYFYLKIYDVKFLNLINIIDRKFMLNCLFNNYIFYISDNEKKN